MGVIGPPGMPAGMFARGAGTIMSLGKQVRQGGRKSWSRPSFEHSKLVVVSKRCE